MRRAPDVTLSHSVKRPSARHGRSDAAAAAPCATTERSFTNSLVEERAILCRPRTPARDAAVQAEAAYRALAKLLAVRQASFASLTTEMLFLRNIRRDLPLVLAARARVLAELGQSPIAPAPAFIEQAPIEEDALLEVTAWSVVTHPPEALEVRNLRPIAACPCDACALSGARLVRRAAAAKNRAIPGAATEPALEPPSGEHSTSLYTANIYGVGEDAYAQAFDMFTTAERLLEQCGMDFHHVIRTWIYLRDIGRDYDALNAARRDFFCQRGIECRPASTGVEGTSFSDTHDLSLRLQAMRASHLPAVTPMSTPNLNEAWTYGVDFSRGLRVEDANHVALHISGTASLDASGQSIHNDDIEAQADRMLDNIESLLARQGASFADIVSGVTYLKYARDAGALKERCQRRGYAGFPCAVVEAALCRPELLCEAEVVAMLPFPPPRA